MELKFKATGVAGHAALDTGINAIYRALDIIKTLDKIAKKSGHMEINVFGIKGGTQHNIIPDVCRFTASLKTDGAISEKDALREIRNAMPPYCKITAYKTSYYDRNRI